MQAIIYCYFSAFSNCMTVHLTRRFNRINTDIFISSGNFYLSKYQPLHTLYNIYKIRKKRMKAQMKYPPSSISTVTSQKKVSWFITKFILM